MKTDGDIMGKKRKDNKRRITESRKKEDERDTERNEARARSDKDRVRNRGRSRGILQQRTERQKRAGEKEKEGCARGFRSFASG